jgi:hypothetical protein
MAKDDQEIRDMALLMEQIATREEKISQSKREQKRLVRNLLRDQNKQKTTAEILNGLAKKEVDAKIKSRDLSKMTFSEMAKQEDVLRSMEKDYNKIIKDQLKRFTLSGKLYKIWKKSDTTWYKLKESARVTKEHYKEMFNDWRENSFIFASAVRTFQVFGAAGAMAWRGIKAVMFEYYEYLQKNVAPMMATLNRELGMVAGSKTRQQAERMGNVFDEMGLGFAEGAKSVAAITKGMQGMNIPDSTMEIGLKFSHLLGMGAEEAGKLMFQFERSGQPVQNLEKAMLAAANSADRLGMPVNTIMKDMADAPEVMHRFGTANVMQFEKAATRARTYGMTIKDVNQAFGKTMDTFDSTSSVASKLNAVFGTNINSLRLMMEKDPSKRMEMVSKALKDQKVNYNALSPFQKNFLMQTLQINEQRLQMMTGTNAQREAIKKENKEKERAAKINQWWTKGIQNVRENIMNVDFELKNMMRSIANVVYKLLGYENAQEGTMEGVKGFKKLLSDITGMFDTFAKTIDDPIFDLKGFLKDPGKTLSQFGDYLKDAKGFVVDLKEAFMTLKEVLQSIAPLAKTTGEAFSFFTGQSFLDKQAENDEKRLAPLEKNAQSAIALAQERKELGLKPGESLDAALRNQMPLEGIGWREGAGAMTVDDALITKTGKIVKFNPNDNIMAFQGGMPSGGSSPEMKREIMALRQAISELKDAYAKDTVKVEMAEVRMDGKKVGEAQIRLARSQI